MHTQSNAPSTKKTQMSHQVVAFIKTYLPTISIVLGMGAGIFNLLTAAQLAPLAKDQAVIVERVRANENNIVWISTEVDKRLSKMEENQKEMNQNIVKILINMGLQAKEK